MTDAPWSSLTAAQRRARVSDENRMRRNGLRRRSIEGLRNLPRTPWKERKASNANEISVKHVEQFIVETLHIGNIEMQDFLNWVGLKATKTALAKAGIALRKAGRMA